MSTQTKRVKLKLVGLDGNAFFLMGAWQRQARKEKWTKDEIDAVQRRQCQATTTTSSARSQSIVNSS